MTATTRGVRAPPRGESPLSDPAGGHPPRVGVYTLGCKVNQYETQRMVQALAARGFVAVPFQTPAEAYLVNTCTVTAVADKKARRIIRAAHRLNPAAVIAVCGCYAEVDRPALERLPGVAIVRGDRDKMEVTPLLADEVERRLRAGGLRAGPAPLPACSGARARARGYLVVQNGCDFTCAYCIIPRARGPQRSRRIPELLEEARVLAAQGRREIVLTGVRLGAFGYDWAERRGRRGEPLARLLEGLHQIAGLERIRLSSLLPIDVHREWLRAMAQLPAVCPHLHLALQSGDDATLRRMRRGYTSRRYAMVVEQARALMPELALTTDVMVGFPGETEEAFERSCVFMERMGFSRLHIFKFSARPGTRAENLPDQVPEAVKEARSARLFELARAASERYHRRFAGRTLAVLTESVDPATGSAQGLTPHYVRVRFRASAQVGDIVPVRIARADGEGLLGVWEDDGRA